MCHKWRPKPVHTRLEVENSLRLSVPPANELGQGESSSGGRERIRAIVPQRGLPSHRAGRANDPCIPGLELHCKKRGKIFGLNGRAVCLRWQGFR